MECSVKANMPSATLASTVKLIHRTTASSATISLSATSSRDCPNLKPVIENSRKKHVLRLPLIRSQDARFVAPLMGATIYYRLIKSIKTLIASSPSDVHYRGMAEFFHR